MSESDRLESIERFKAETEAKQAQRRIAGEISMLVLRSLILVSGGAVIGLLTFIGNVWIRDVSIAHQMAHRALWATGFFVAALWFSLVAAFLGYLSALTFSRAMAPPSLRVKLERDSFGLNRFLGFPKG